MRRISFLFCYLISEGFLFFSYAGHKASFHWFTHFFVGASFALIMMALWQFFSKQIVSKPLLWIFIAHIYAMFPDFLFQIWDIPHRRWMDIFFGHITAHFVPGRNWTWYAVFLFSLAIFLISIPQKKVIPGID